MVRISLAGDPHTGHFCHSAILSSFPGFWCIVSAIAVSQGRVAKHFIHVKQD
jgi:hypothetical protein